jgi:3-oxoacyl-[acyl-carrier protein] reductase
MGVLENKKIIITGGSMGIGFAVAQKCAEEGAHLILISRHRKDLEKAIKMIVGNDKNHMYYAMDVSQANRVKKMAGEIKKKLNFIDGLVNCAGIYGPIGRSDEINPIEFKKTININLLGTFNMCHYFIPLLKKANRGKIVNYSGGGAAGPFPNYSAYAVSKIGIVRFTENLALELINDNIDVNAVAPGFVVTRLHQQTLKAGKKAGVDFFKETLDQIDKGGVSSDKAAKLTTFLLSSDSDVITGKFISAPWDQWEDKSFQMRLKKDKDFATLRRIDDKFFFKIIKDKD